MTTSLKTVTDRFSLFNNPRKFSGNNRDYALSAVKNTLESPATQELISLGEAYGYYGHGRRQMAGKLEIPETMVINVNGKPVVVDNIPSNRTLAISVDGNGIVSHTEEILSTDSGRIVNGLLESRAGGWSWASGGPDGKKAIMRVYMGMDYVKNPNYISMDHPSFLLESGSTREQQEEMILESLKSQGFSSENSLAIKNNFEQNEHESIILMNLEEDMLLLEGILYGRNKEILELQETRNLLQSKNEEAEKLIANRREMLLETAKKLPVFISEEQVEALVNMSTEQDAKIFELLFESAMKGGLKTLPLKGNTHERISMNISNAKPAKKTQSIDFSDTPTPKFK